MAIFPHLINENKIQVGDKTRLDANKSFVTEDEDAISLLRIKPSASDSFIDVTTNKRLDWIYTTDGTKTITVEVTAGTGVAGTPEISTIQTIADGGGGGGLQEITEYTFQDDVSGSYNDNYFVHYTQDYPSGWVAYFNVDGNGSGAPGFSPDEIEINITENESAGGVAAAVQSDFFDILATISQVSGVVSPSDVITATNAANENVADSFATTGGAGDFEITNINFAATDGSEYSGGQYFKIYSGINIYGVWFNVNSGDIQPIDGEVTTWVEVPFSTGDDETVMSDAVFNELDIAHSGDIALNDLIGAVEIENSGEGNVTDCNDGGSGFNGIIDITQQGVDNSAGLPATINILQQGSDGAGTFEITEIDFNILADAGDVAGGIYLKIYSDVEVYGTWFNVDGAESEPIDVDVTIWVEIPLSFSDDAGIMSDTLLNELDTAHAGDLSLSDLGGSLEITVTVEADVTDVNDGGSGFNGDIIVTQQGAAGGGGGGLNDTYFLYNTPSSDYAFYMDVDGGGLAPGVATIEVAVAVMGGDTANDVAAALQSAMDGVTGITATVLTDIVTANNDNDGAVTDASDFDSGFTIGTTQQGANGTGGSPVTKDFTIESISVVDDCLFSDDQMLVEYEGEILKYVRNGRFSWLDKHRSAQERIIEFLDENEIWKIADADNVPAPYTKADICLLTGDNFEQFKDWSRFLTLEMIYFDLKKQVDDVFTDKYIDYKKKRIAASNRSVLRLDKNGGGTITADEIEYKNQGRIVRR